MHQLSDTDRSQSSGDESWEAGDSQSVIEAKQLAKEMIEQANSVALLHIFKHYGIRGTDSKWKMRCPFKSHAGGQEHSASFWYYPDTKTFWCFGCNTGRRSCNFVAAMENISITVAARKILELYGSEAMLEPGELGYTPDYSERLEILLEFSDSMREFLQANPQDLKALAAAEKIAKFFDKLNAGKNPDIELLKRLALAFKDMSEIVNSYSL